MSSDHQSDNSPIFIIGTERSGTNLLRLILNVHSAIAVPHPPHIMKLFMPLLPGYGNLAVDSNFRRLIADVCRMVELHPYPWEINPDRERVFHEARSRELICIYFAIYDQYLRWSGKERWCCKSTFMIDHVGDILRYQPQARFIFMVRDGRDVAVSAKSSIFNHYHVYYTARRWQREQQLGLDWLARLPPEQIILVRYEELLVAPEATVQRLCGFLEVPYSDNMLEYHRFQEAKKSGGLSISWENTAKPVLAENRGKFRNQLTEGEIFHFEALAMEELLQLAYPLTNKAEQLMQMRDQLAQERPAYRAAELAREIMIEARHLLKDRNSFARIRKNIFMTFIRLTRQPGKLNE